MHAPLQAAEGRGKGLFLGTSCSPVMGGDSGGCQAGQPASHIWQLGAGGVAGSRAGCVLLRILISAAVAAGWLLDSAILALNLTMHSAASRFMLLLNDSVHATVFYYRF